MAGKSWRLTVYLGRAGLCTLSASCDTVGLLAHLKHFLHSGFASCSMFSSGQAPNSSVFFDYNFCIMTRH